MTKPGISGFTTFGDLLKYLRKRAQLTQRELAIAVGYSEAHVSRLEKNQRLPDLATTAALIIPALDLDDEPEAAAHLMQLAAATHEVLLPANQSLALAHTRETIEVSESSESIPSNLPLQLTSFIGRRTEMDEITHLLSRDHPARLVTLVGPGGIGKTRLALQTTISLLHLYQDGAWFVDLAPISSPELIPQIIASIFGVTEMHGQSIEESFVLSLHSKQALILVDNCEHLIHAATENIQKILSSCAHIQILATSREPLTIPGEVILQIHPLSLPESLESPNQNMLRYDSVKLFIERSHNIQPSFAVTDSNLAVIARICRRLDGMPLAIELAAAAIDFLSIGQIETYLDDRFHLLTRGQRTLPRHQTLRATIEWSYGLLEEAEQILFRRLAVFAGGWTLEAANVVCVEKDHAVLDLLARLVHKSLVVAEMRVEAEARYTMLETIREYAREKLLAAGEREQMRAGHFDYFFLMAQQAEPKLFSEESSIDWAEVEIDNLRAALTWALERDPNGDSSEERTGRALELMLHLWPLWLNRGYSIEGNELLNKLLSMHTVASPARARALLLAGDFAGLGGDSIGKYALIQESLTLARELGDKKRTAMAMMEMGLVKRDQHYSEGIEFLTASLGMFEELNENPWVYRTSFLLAETYMTSGNLETAKPLWKHGLDLCRKEHDKFHIAWGLEGLGNLERLEGHFEQARQLYTESLPLKASVMDKMGIMYSLAAFAQLAAAQKQFKRAATLWGATERLGETMNLLLIASNMQLYTSLIADTHSLLGEESFQAAWAKGKAMKMHDAIEYALSLPHN
jgi:predicted ATPase/transcriptional regulator with XRE-family HTH domain